MTWLIEPLRRVLCGLRGHDTIMEFEHDRLSLRCMSCSFRTRGWSLGSNTSNGPSVNLKGSPRRAHDRARARAISSRSGGASFADRSAHADRVDSGSATKGPQAIGDRPRSRAKRLAS
jgi:hypothetical protein